MKPRGDANQSGECYPYPLLAALTETGDETLQDFRRKIRQALVREGNAEVFSPFFFSCKKASLIIIPSQTAAIHATVLEFRRWIEQCCQKEETFTLNIGVCLQEALVNAIIHGNLEIPSNLKKHSWEQFETLLQERETLPKFANRQVIIRCQMQQDSIQLEVEDEGYGFNPNQILPVMKTYSSETNATDPDSLLENGRGILIITSLMDAVFWNSRGNCITMIKNIPSS
jgi:anti-sigma regulatory factor (Ser/Thr protein kinase)